MALASIRNRILQAAMVASGPLLFGANPAIASILAAPTPPPSTVVSTFTSPSAQPLVQLQGQPTGRVQPGARVSSADTVAARVVAQAAERIRRHQWDALYEMFDPFVRDAQRSIGVGKGQFLGESMGAFMSGSPLVVEEYQQLDKLAALERITDVSFEAEPRRMRNGLLIYIGKARLDDGTDVRLELLVEPIGRGFRLTGGVG
jgi:hypothetical protein